ncbi:MAG: PAS-domain containing protein [Pseudomonadota bacterium]
MVSASNLLSFSLVYVCVLFAVAWYVDRNTERGAANRRPQWRGIVYALTLAVYCTSWTFYGAVGSATNSAWSHAPVYLGPILVFLLAWPVLRRLMSLGVEHRVTSIADYIGARFGKRQSLAIIVSLVATAAVLPYIALQFKALAQAWAIVGGSAEGVEAMGADSALLIAMILAVFTILFGTRRLDGRERHQGIMTAVAVESVVKLLAFVAVAVLALRYLNRAPVEPMSVTSSQALGSFALDADFIARTLISGLAILCLPRQFHVMVVEAQSETDTRYARWLFPLYLLLFMLLVLPISLAGSQIFAVAEDVNPDTYVQLLPVALESSWITGAAFIGGISAATGMVIVATVALAIMITNEIVTPLIMRINATSPAGLLKLGDNLRRIRQIVIALILLAAWLVTQLLVGIPWLAQIGFISFLAAAQLAPALMAGLYWRRAHGLAVTVGLLLGLGLWFYSGVLPAILPDDHSLLLQGPMGVSWLRPLGLLGIEGDSRLPYATAWSLGLNVASLTLLSLLLRPSPADIRQARVFMDEAPANADADFELSLIRVSQLQALLPPFMAEGELRAMWLSFEDRYQQRLLPGDRAPQFVVTQVESVLASVIGATSAEQAMEQLETAQQLQFSDLAGMVSDASKLNTFNRELLQTTVESLLQGVSVVDAQLRLVAWNKRYEELFAYPERFLYVGCPIERVYRYNADRGILTGSGTDTDAEIARRLEHMRAGSPHRLERQLPDGRVIDIRGTPLPQGGFVTTFIDITDYREMLAQLEDAKIELEAKVESDSQVLSEANARLRQENRLRAQMESSLRDAHQSKTRFMSATSHDLLQPINAARLFAAALKPQLEGAVDQRALRNLDQIDASLKRAEQLIAELREIARLDSGRQLPQLSHFELGEVFGNLQREFEAMAARSGLQLRVINTRLWLHSDARLVFRILQNLLANALKYTDRGSVLLGVRRVDGKARVQVIDTGPGIAEQDRVRIFEEFERLKVSAEGEEGLGLGLAIVRRYADLLELPLSLSSERGRGTVFSLDIPLGEAQLKSKVREATVAGDLAGLDILCLDNDPLVLEGMEQFLRASGACVTVASNRDDLLARKTHRIDVLLVDYHLDGGDTGVAAAREYFASGAGDAPCIVISADDSPVVREKARQAGFRFLPKPVNQNRLRALVRALVQA